MYEWDFSKLPNHEYARTLKAYDDQDVDELVKIHNTYKLSRNKYCCNPKEAMMNWFGYAIELKQIL